MFFYVELFLFLETELFKVVFIVFVFVVKLLGDIYGQQFINGIK